MWYGWRLVYAARSPAGRNASRRFLTLMNAVCSRLRIFTRREAGLVVVQVRKMIEQSSPATSATIGNNTDGQTLAVLVPAATSRCSSNLTRRAAVRPATHPEQPLFSRFAPPGLPAASLAHHAMALCSTHLNLPEETLLANRSLFPPTRRDYRDVLVL